jgi:neutral ceramidase
MQEAAVSAANRRMMIPPRPLPDAAETKAKWEAARERAARETNPELKWKTGREAQVAFEAWDVVRRYSEPQEAEAQAIRVGDLAIASTPGEMFTEWGLMIKRESPAPHTFVSELSNGWIGYMLNPGGFSEAGYEAAPGTWTQTNEEGGAILTEAAIDLIRGLWQ